MSPSLGSQTVAQEGATLREASFFLLQDRSPPAFSNTFQGGTGFQLPLGLRQHSCLTEHVLLPGAGKVAEPEEAQAVRAAAARVRAQGREGCKEHGEWTTRRRGTHRAGRARGLLGGVCPPPECEAATTQT